MKAVIVELHSNTAVILSAEGCIVSVKNNNYQIGQEIEINMKKEFKPKKMFVFASTAACLLFVCGIGAHAYYTPYTYVSLDVNPSIEYSVNKFDRVLSASGVNDDGTEIINELSLDTLKNKSITDAISLTVDEIYDAGYLDSDTSGIVITTSSEDVENADELALDLKTTATEVCENNDLEPTVTAESVGTTRVAEARELGVTPGKLNLVEKLIEASDNSESIDINEWLHKSVKEVMSQTKAYKEQNKKQNKEQNKEQAEEPNEEANEEQNEETNKELNKEQNKKHVQKTDTYTQTMEEGQSEESNDSLKTSESVSANSISDNSDTTKTQNENFSNNNSNATKEKDKSLEHENKNDNTEKNSHSDSKKKDK